MSNSLVHQDTASFITPIACRPSALTAVKNIPASPQTGPTFGTARRPQSRRSGVTAFFVPFVPAMDRAEERGVKQTSKSSCTKQPEPSRSSPTRATELFKTGPSSCRFFYGVRSSSASRLIRNPKGQASSWYNLQVEVWLNGI